MRLEPLYTVTFTTTEAWSVEVASDAGIEGRSFLLDEGRSTGRLSARYRAANFPRKRADSVLVPEFRGVLETDDGAVEIPSSLAKLSTLEAYGTGTKGTPARAAKIKKCNRIPIANSSLGAARHPQGREGRDVRAPL